MTNGIILVDCLNCFGRSGQEITPLVADLVNVNGASIDLISVETLDADTVTGILRGFRFAQQRDLWETLLLLGGRLLDSPNALPNVFEELLSTLATIHHPEDLEATKTLLDGIVSGFPQMAAAARALLLQAASATAVGNDDKASKADVLKSAESLPYAELIANPYSTPVSPGDNRKSFSVCQISDIHFGKFHAYHLEEHGRKKYTGPTADIKNFLQLRLEQIPDYYILCGDISSDRADDMDYLADFAHQLPTKSGVSIKECLFIVPGNHDAIWNEDSNDQLEAFKRKVVDNGFRTPFGDTQSIKRDYDGCPVSLYFDHANQMAFLLLTSCYYSGEVEAKISDLLSKLHTEVSDLDKEMQNRIRNEYGYLHDGYIGVIEELLYEARSIVGQEQLNSYTKIAAIHHHFEAIGDDYQITHKGIALRQMLRQHGFRVILHGHVHQHSVGAIHDSTTQALSCPSLSGRCCTDKNGFQLLHFPKDLAEEVEGYRYSLDHGSTMFNTDAEFFSF